ncbi:MAG TPA: TIGR02147 family protein [Bdellovibrionota bacterium]|nr:TIGR02147 family protein [Bdellovibrionota bacterium]
MLSIYNYSDPTRFLKDAWEAKRERNPAFSIRSWAKTLGLEAHAPLSLILSGKRDIPRKYIPQFIQSLGLQPREGLYFETLVELQRSKGPQQKDFYLKRLAEISPREPVRMVEVESFKCLSNPLHMTLLEMVDLAGFSPDPRWIRSRLAAPASIREIEECLERLIALGLMKEGPDGKLTKTNRHLTTRPDNVDQGVQDYHRKTLALAAEAVARQAVPAREYNGYAFNIREESIPRAKELIRKFCKDMMQELETRPGDGTQTYQLAVQFFGLTQTVKEGERK